jgi:hypothetical protein
MKLKKLPIGESSFENIIKENRIYVDKTKLLYELITTSKFYFLSRPRRFGKSLFVSTLECIFKGKKKLFKDLWIYNSNYEWKEHPVIVLDFNGISLETSEIFENSLSRYLKEKAQSFNLSLTGITLKEKFKELVVKLAKETGESVVLLIDEYDKPIISHLGKGEEALEIAKRNREILKSFFGTIKEFEVIKNLRFVLLTGVSKFSKAGVFSELNNLEDFTMSYEYSSLLGITDEEIEKYFQEYIKICADFYGKSISEMKQIIKDYYNGYRFSRKKEYVYNPFSLLNFLKQKEIKNYWFESGTPTFLVNLLKEENFYLPKVESLIVEESIFSSYELDNLDPTALLFQTGYLTIKEYDFEMNEYVLSYPNKEVKYSFLKILYRSYVNGADRDNKFLELGRTLKKGDLKRFIDIAKSIFSGIAYSVGSRLNEANFHTLFYLMLNAGGVPAEIELLSCDGRIDMLVRWKERVYIIEFKCNQSADRAIEQIKEKNYVSRITYHGLRQKIYLIGINFDTNKRNITDWKCVEYSA